MNDDIVQGQWKQLKGQVRQWWGKITDEAAQVEILDFYGAEQKTNAVRKP